MLYITKIYASDKYMLCVLTGLYKLSRMKKDTKKCSLLEFRHEQTNYEDLITAKKDESLI